MNAAAANNAKKIAAKAALDALEGQLHSDAVLGVGTGTTVNCFLDLLASRRHRLGGAVPTSAATQARLEQQNIRILSLNDASLQLYVDGADEIDPQLRLIKGGGGALTLEKIVASATERFICIADASKYVPQLGAFPLPIEIMAQAQKLVCRELVAMGGQPSLRAGYITEQGNPVLAVSGLRFSDPKALESQINDIPGVVCCGVFAHRPADTLYLGSEDGCKVLRR